MGRESIRGQRVRAKLDRLQITLQKYQVQLELTQLSPIQGQPQSSPEASPGAQSSTGLGSSTANTENYAMAKGATVSTATRERFFGLSRGQVQELIDQTGRNTLLFNAAISQLEDFISQKYPTIDWDQTILAQLDTSH